MKQLLALALCFIIPVVGFAAESGYKVKYDGGSVPNVKAGNDVRLTFDASQITLTKNKVQATTIRPAAITEISKMSIAASAQQSASACSPWESAR